MNKSNKPALDSVDENRSSRPPVPKKVSSLIPTSVRLGKGKEVARGALGPSATGRLTPSAASIRSFSSTVLSRKRKLASTASLETMPSEIQDQIFSQLPQETLHSLLQTSSAITEAAAIAMYNKPKFASTYRFAQFVTTVTHNKQYAGMVRDLDLSTFNKEGEENLPIAGWREWKWRSEPLYALSKARDSDSDRLDAPPAYNHKSTHPRAHKFLKDWHTCRDVPIGAILHVLEACKRIKKLDLSTLSLDDDYAVHAPKTHPPTAFTHLIFVSDIPKSWTWKPDSDGLKAVYLAEISTAIARLSQLERVRIRKVFWLGPSDVALMVRECPRLQRVDFRDSGMKMGLEWACKGSREDVRDVLDRREAVTSECTRGRVRVETEL